MSETRLAPRNTEIIDRSQSVDFRFNGSTYSGFRGDTVSSALWANGCRILSRSFKYHRPRADVAFDGSDCNGLVQREHEPNARAGTLELEPGMQISPQNVSPSLGWDFLALNNVAHAFLPVGFYYKAFHTRALWPVYERMLRRLAGLGRVDAQTPDAEYHKEYRYADVVIVGGGLAGLAAAQEAAARGVHVLLIEREPSLGGTLRFRGVQSLPDALSAMVRDLQTLPGNVEVLLGATAVGWFDDHSLAVAQAERLIKVRGKQTIMATGGFDRLGVFDRNDLPGILTLSGAWRLLSLYAVAPGQKVVIASGQDDGLEFALALKEVGIDVVVAESRSFAELEASLQERLQQAQVEMLDQANVLEARGSRRLRAVSLQAQGQKRTLACDTLVIAAGYWPNHGLYCQAGGSIRYDPAHHQFLPAYAPKGVVAAGRLAGLSTLETAVQSGRFAAGQVLNSLGLEASSTVYPPKPSVAPAPIVAEGKSKFRFVDFAEDVTEKDLQDAMGEGYDRQELLKRFATISMGPDQGRYGLFESSLLATHARGLATNTAQVTTSRPPLFSTKMGVFAGRRLHPIRRTPMHTWFEEYGCTWLDAGAWRRPDVLAGLDPIESAKRVREAVGIVDVSTLGKIQISGPDAVEVLSRIYVNKWRKLAPGRVRYGVMCTETGAIIDDGVAAHLEDGTYYLSTTTAHADLIPRLIRGWNERHWHLDFQMVNLTQQHAAINVAGPRSRELLGRLTDANLVSHANFPPMTARRLELVGVPCLAFRIGYTGELGYELHIPAGYAAGLWSKLMAEGKGLGVVPFGMETLNILRLEKGHVIVGLDTDELSSPVEMGMNELVKFDKREFWGKEGMSRKLQDMRSRGTQRQLIGFQLRDTERRVPDGAILVRESAEGGWDKCGWVTSCRFSPQLGRSIGLAWVEGLEVKVGDAVRIRSDRKSIEAEVVQPPFFDPDGSRMKR